MAVSTEVFPTRKRRPSAGAFISTDFSDHALLRSLLLLSKQASSLSPPACLLKRNSSSIIHKTNLLALLFEDLFQRDPVVVPCFPPLAALCFEELYILLQRIKALIADCANGSKLWLLIQQESIASTFQELTTELFTLLDILPIEEMNLDDDIEELVHLIKKQCVSTKKIVVDPVDRKIQTDVIETLDRIKREIVPDQIKLGEIFYRLRLRDSTSCREEIEALEEEVRNQVDEGSKTDAMSLIGLVRYAKCVLYGESNHGASRVLTPCSSSSLEFNFPSDFRCPISLELMRDPVVVSTGQSYDRSSIALWIESGHDTCPKTGQKLVHTEFIANLAVKNLIAIWCRERKIPFELKEDNGGMNGTSIPNKAMMEATKMTVLFLVNKLQASPPKESANNAVHELRTLAKTDPDSRVYIADAGVLPLLVKCLSSDHPNLQVDAVTTILNLSILEANKARIMETDGVLNGVIEVLRSGATWEAKGNAAAAIFSLAGVQAFRRKLGRETRVVRGLVELARSGTLSSKRDALAAILKLAGDKEVVVKLVEAGVVEMVSEVIDTLPEEGVTVLEVVVKKGGLQAIAAAYHVIRKLATVFRDGADRAQESAAATLVNICRKGGSEVVAEVAAVPGIERVIWEVMGMGTSRGRRKAATLLRILHGWVAGLYNIESIRYESTDVTSAQIVLPG